MEWKYERVESKREEVAVGEHRIRINSVEKAVSQNGRDMLKLVFDVSGTTSKLFNYIVFLDEHPEITNRKLTQLFDSFGIEDCNFNLASWVGKVGACMVKHDDEGRAVINYYIDKRRQGNMPPWKEPNGTSVGVVSVDVDDDDLPF